MIIDAHMHLWDKIDGRMGYQKVKPLKDGMIQVGRQKVQGMPSWFSDCRNPAELALATFDEAGVNAAVVTQEYLDGNQNNYLRRVKNKYPDRFFVHGLIDFTRPNKIVGEFQKVVRQGFEGIKCPAMFLPQLNNSVSLADPRLMVIWEEMAERGMVLSIDLAAGDVQVRQLKRVIETYPRLKIAIGHFGMVGHGNWMAQIHLAQYKNVYIECGGIIWLFRQEGPPFKKAQAKIKQAVRAVGARKIMWGSDYPRTMVDFTYRQSLEFAVLGCDFLTEKERTNFLGGNAARLYGFPSKLKGRSPRKHITEF